MHNAILGPGDRACVRLRLSSFTATKLCACVSVPRNDLAVPDMASGVAYWTDGWAHSGRQGANFARQGRDYGDRARAVRASRTWVLSLSISTVNLAPGETSCLPDSLATNAVCALVDASGPVCGAECGVLCWPGWKGRPIEYERVETSLRHNYNRDRPRTCGGASVEAGGIDR